MDRWRMGCDATFPMPAWDALKEDHENLAVTRGDAECLFVRIRVFLE